MMQYIGGGNTFKLLKELRETGFDLKIQEYLNQGRIVYGGSAGAIICGNSIDICQLGAISDKNKVNLKQTNGLEIILGYDIQCHYNESQLNLYLQYNSKTKRPIIAIPEESVVFIEGNICKILGTEPVILIKNENYEEIKPNQTFNL